MPRHDATPVGTAPDGPALIPVEQLRTIEHSKDRGLATVLFCLLAIFHLWAIGVGWKSGLLLGNEFRQSQTAITTLFIQREHNFSLAYPTPVLGKPWSVPMEFPLYQWTVAVVSSATGLPVTQAARAVSSVCFYLSLPALWLLFARLRLNPAQRWVALGVMLTCPLYIFYGRAFLIETMALMFSLWFVQSFIAAVEQRSVLWLLVANIAGVGAGLVKVTSFMLYLVPAAICAAIWLGRAWRERRISGSRDFWRTTAWMGASVALPFAATWWWIRLADAIKALNASGVQLTSSSMSSYHLGTWETRLSSEIWLAHWRTLTTNLAPVAALVVFVGVALVFGGKWRKWILGATLLFLAVPATFPVLYAWHEYYFVANGVLLMAAIGLSLGALIESRARRWVVWGVILGLHATQAWCYFHYVYPEQRLPYPGGSGLTRLIRDVTEPQDVLIIAGNDWSSVIPFFSERRALMIRRNLEIDEPYLDHAFAEISDESVPLLIVVGDVRVNRAFIERVSRQFDIDPDPLLTHNDQTVYVARSWREEYIRRLLDVVYHDVVLANPSERQMSSEPKSSINARTTSFFAAMTPQPVRYQLPFGLSFSYERDGLAIFGAHAPGRLWFRSPFPTRQVVFEYGISEPAYTREGERTDGVEFRIVEQRQDGSQEILFSRFLDPVEEPADRGLQRTVLNLAVPAEVELMFETRPGPAGANAFDWAYFGKIEVK